MDLTNITDIKELKSMAYDTLAVIESNQNFFKSINNRIAELLKQPEPQEPEKPKKTKS